jgi:hypothetical protein
MQTHDQRIAWWRNARFGMFIHWGVYSALEGEWHGVPVVGYAEHIQRKSKIPISVYKQQVAGNFRPDKFDAAAWARLAKDAGMGYMVITSKHHDGFAMFDSDVSDYNVVRATPWHHDPMKDLQAACTANGLRFGFYYSQAWDWGDPNGTGNDWDFDCPAGDKQLHGGKLWWEESPQWVAQTRQYVDDKVIPQIRELFAKYQPDIIWFDTPGKMPPALNYEVFKATRQIGPNAVINSRCVEELGDYLSTADRPAEFAPQQGDWEAIPTTNESYGYHKADRSHKPASHFIELIAKSAARGGNLMLNVGPRGDGTLDPADVAILQGIGKWMKVNGESIHGTTRTPLPVQAWGESTRKGGTLYLHVLDWPTSGELVVGGLKPKVKSAYLLSDPNRSPLAVSRLGALDVRIAVPNQPPDAVDSVVVVECDGADIAVDDKRLLSLTQPNNLRVFDGRLCGTTIKFGAGKRDNAYIETWPQAGDSICWDVRVTEPTAYRVSVTYDADAASAGGIYHVTGADKALGGTIKEGKELTETLGTIKFEPGVHEIRVAPGKLIDGQDLMHLRTLTLTALQQAVPQAVGNETTSVR